MAINDKPRPLAAIIGERMRQFREDRELRQSDIAAAAAECGLTWGRSSVAALEAGTRNLSLGELFMLPWVITNAGGWDQPLLPPDSEVSLSDFVQTTPRGMVTSLAMLLEPIGKMGAPAPGGLQRLLDDQYGRFEDPSPSSNGDLDSARLAAEDIAWRYACACAYPFVDYDEAGRQTAAEFELATKIANRLELPNGQSADWHPVMVFSWGLWGHSAGVERDQRAELRSHSTRRALQSARGHVTRDLISELTEEAKRKWSIVQGVLDQLQPIWGDADALIQWYQGIYGMVTQAKTRARQLAAGDEFKKDHQAVEGLKEIATQLRDARAQAKLSAKDVEDITGLREWEVAEIEEASYIATARFTKARRTIRMFALAVGMDPREVIKRYDAATKKFIERAMINERLQRTLASGDSLPNEGSEDA